MVKVGLMGGSFNPPTLGHEFVASLAKGTGVDEVWLMPCYKSLYGKNLAPDAQRVFMLKLIANKPWLKISTWELDNKIEGRTYDIMDRLCDEHPDIDFSFVIGGDNADKVKSQWYRGGELIKKQKFIVIARGGYEIQEDWFKEEPHKYVETDFSSDASSTEVRTLIAEGKYIEAQKLLAIGTLPYILSYNLYGGPRHD